MGDWWYDSIPGFKMEVHGHLHTLADLTTGEEGSRDRASLPEGGPGGRASLLRTPKDMLSKTLEWASVSIGTPLLGNMEGRSFLRAFEIERYIKIYVKCPVSWVSVCIGALLGNLEGIRLPGHFERKGKYIWAPFLDSEDIKILSLGAIWNFGKGIWLS